MTQHPIPESRRGALASAGLDPDAVADVIARTIAEDLAGGEDVTTNATVPADQRSHATFGVRAAGCAAGLDIAAAVIDAVCGPGATFRAAVRDGDRVAAGTVLATVEAPTRTLLTAERTALNLLCHLSGVATATAAWVDAIAGTGAVVRDTRKTTPGLRALEKYAVRCGGGQNHRMSLSDAALVKDNHIAAAGGVREAFAAVRARAAHLPIEIEVDDLDQLREAIDAGADLVLLDNMSPSTMREAVSIAASHREATGRAVLLEASGGLSLATARAVAETGVDFISVGALTHSSPILDIGLDVVTVS
ncbi:MAG: carboxylating nicotinate-nucleotide diphosphorylase [Actinomycetota bacterium]